jgi:hypothetical protein
MDDILRFNTPIEIPDSELTIPNTLFSYRRECILLKDYIEQFNLHSEVRIYEYSLWHNKTHKVYWTSVPSDVYNHREYLKLKYG